MKNFTQVNRASSGAKKNFTQLESNLSGMAWFLHVIERRFSSADKLSGSRSERSLTSEETSIQHPFSIHSASIEHPLEAGGNQVATRSLFRIWKYVAMITLLLTLGVGEMWGEDITITPTYENRYSTMPYGLVKVTGSVTPNSSSEYIAASNGGSFTITFETTKSDIYIKTVNFQTVSNGTLTPTEGHGSYDNEVFTASSNKSSVTLTMASSSGVKGKLKISNIVISTGSNEVETLSAFSVSSNTINATAKIDGSTVTSAVSMTTTSATASDGILSLSNNNSITFTSSNNIKYIALFNKDNKADQSNKFKVGDTKLDGAVWSGSAKSVTISNATGAARTISYIWVITEAPDCTSHSVNLSSSGSVTGGTFTTSSATVCEGETATLTATPAAGYEFTSWSATGTGGHSLSSTTTNPATLTMGTADVTVGATFTKVYVPAGASYNFVNQGDGSVTWGSSSHTVTLPAGTKTTVPAGSRVDNIFFSTALDIEYEKGAEEGTGYRGWKIKQSGKLAFYVENDCDVIVTNGIINGMKIHYYNQSNVETNTNLTSTAGTREETAHVKGGTLFEIVSTTTSTNTLKGIRVSSSCTAPNHVDVAATSEAGNYGWRYTTGETIKLTAKAYSSAGTSSEITSGLTYQWKKKTGESTWKTLTNGVDATDGGTFSGTTSANLQISGCTSSNAGTYKCEVSTGTGCTTTSNEYWVRVFTLDGNYSGQSWVKQPIVWTDEYNGTVTLNNINANTTYYFKVTDNDSHWYGKNTVISEDQANFWIYRNDNTDVAMNTGKVSGTYTIVVNVAHANDDNNPYCTLISVTYPKMRIYMSGGETTWCSSDPVFFAHAYKGSTSTDVKMTAHLCESGLFYADVPSYNTNVVFTRQKTGSTEIAWYGNANFWNKSDEITIGSNNKFTCTGWNTTPEPDQGSFSGSSSFSPTTYTISFAANGGSSSMTDIDGIECDADQAITANAYTKTGYTFAGWKANVDVKISGSTVSAGTVISDGATIQNIRGDITLTAQWTAKQCTVTFDKNSGSGGSDNATATYNAAMPDITPPTRAGYDFAGYWDSESNNDGTGNQYYKADGTSYANWNKNTTSDTPLYAKWTKHTYTVSLDGDGGTVSPTSLDATYQTTLGTSSVLSSTSLSNYSFAGFYTDHGGAGTQLIGSDGKWIKNKSGYTNNESNPKWVATSDVTLYAKWTRTVTIDDNGGSADGSVDVVYKGTAGTPSVPTYAGHTVDLGYYAESGCSTKVMNLDGTLVASVSGWTNSSNKWIQTGSNKLYAHWKCNTPTITDNGDNTVSITVPSGTTVRYTTDGTDPSSSSGTVYSTTFSIAADCTVKATAYESGCTDSEIASRACDYSAPATLYTVTFNTNGGSSQSSITQASEGASITMPSAPTKSGYTFQGWVIGSTTKDASASYTPTANVTAYASWQANCSDGATTTTTFNFNSGSATGLTIASNGSNASYSIVNSKTNNIPVLDGYFLASSFTDNSSGVITITTNDSYTNIDSIKFNSASTDNSNPKIAVYGVKKDGTDSIALLSAVAMSSGTTKTWRATPYRVDIHSRSPKYSGKVRFKLTTGSSGKCAGLDNIVIYNAGGGGGTCYYVTYNGNGAAIGFTADETAYGVSSGTTVTVKSNGAGGAAYAKSGNIFSGWNTKSDGTGTSFKAGDTFTISKDTILYAQWADPSSGDCFYIDDAKKKSDYSVAVGGTFDDTKLKGSITGGTVTNTSTADVSFGGNKTYGIVFDASTKKITVRLSSGTLKSGATIKIGGYTNNSTSQTCGFKVSGNDCSPASVATTSGNSSFNFFTQTYTVSAADGVIGTDSFSITLVDDKTYLDSLYVSGCDDCTEGGLSYATASVTKTICDAAFTNTLSNSNSLTGITYSSTNTSVATVESDGEVTIVGAGTTTIKATAAAQSTYCASEATYSLTVNSGTAAGLSFATASYSKATDDEGFTQTVTNPNSLTGVTYSSSNPSVATVNETTGAVTLVSTGSTTITASTDAQTVSTTCYAAGSASYTISVSGSASCTTLPDYIWKTGSTYTPVGTSHTYADGDYNEIDNSASGTTHISISGTNYEQKSGSLNIGKSKDNYFLITAASGYVIDSIYFYGKMEDGECRMTTDNSSWDAYSAGQTTAKAFAIGVGTRYFGIKNKNTDSPKGVWIRTMRIKVCSSSAKYTVTYNLNGHGDAISATTNITPNTTISAPSAPSADCYTFGGWYKEAGCTNAWTFASDKVTNNMTLYAKWTSNKAQVASTDYGKLVYTVTPAGTADALSVTPVDATGVKYKWLEYTSDDVSSASAVGGATSSSYSPSIASVGTKYYWAVLEHSCGNDTTDAFRIVVNAAKTDPTIAWGNVQLGGKDTDPTYGGGGYTLTGTINAGNALTPTLTTDMITAGEGVVITSKSVNDASKTFSLTFGLTAAFDTTQAKLTDIHFELPGNATYNDSLFATNLDYDKCSSGSASTDVYVVGKSNSTGTGLGSAAYKALKTANTWRSTSSPTFTDKTSADEFSISATDAGKYWAQSTQTFVATTSGATMRAFKLGTKSATITWKNSSLSFSKVRIIGINVGTAASTVSVSNGTTSENFTFAKSDAIQVKEVSLDFTYGDKKGVRFTTTDAKELNVLIELVPTGSDGAGTGTTTTLEWKSGYAPSDIEGWNSTTQKIVKAQADANFSVVAQQTSATNSLGAITYSSNNEEVATVNSTTGEVDIVAGASGGEATFTAEMARSGCYKKATLSYIINVPAQACDIKAGSIAATTSATISVSGSTVTKCSTEAVTLTISGHTTSGTTVTWWKDGVQVVDDDNIYNIEGATLATKAEGTYNAKVTGATCAIATNNIKVVNRSASVSVTKLVNQWYIKNGRVTPDIPLFELGEGCSFVGAKADDEDLSDELGGCTVYQKDGSNIVYLQGKAPSGMTVGDVSLQIEVEDVCGNTETSAAITIHKQVATDKHELAFVVAGTDYNKKTFTEDAWTDGIKASQSTGLALYQVLKDTFKILATNIYASDSIQQIREYYSQFDLICITDYPNTGTKGKHGRSYVDAIGGAMIDVRPLLTMEAYVSGLDNWRAKGVIGSRTTPSKRQYNMMLQCKDHEIFDGTTLKQFGYGDDALFRVNIVDSTAHGYVDLDATSKSTHASDTAALQGFTVGEMLDLLPLGTTDNGSGTDLQVGVERQKVMAARMMVLGINSYAMERLSKDGKQIVVNALQYLTKKRSEDISDCSSYFTNADGDNEWGNPLNWRSGTVPTSNQEARITQPVTISDTRKIASIKIATDGTYQDADVDGSITITSTGTLIVTGKVQSVKSPDFMNGFATSAEDVTIEADDDSQGALILNNEDGTTMATVEMYSKAGYEDDGVTPNFAYVGAPVSGMTLGSAFSGAEIWYYDESNPYWWSRCDDSEASNANFLTYCISHWEPQKFTLSGTLAPTGTQNFTLSVHSGGVEGDNMIANSWTAPIDIAQFETSDFDGAEATLYMYRTGHDEVRGTGEKGEGAGKWTSVSVDAAKSYVWPAQLRMIPSMQAFCIEVEGTHTLTMDYDRLVRANAYTYENGEDHAAILAPKRQMAKANRVDPAEVEGLRLVVNGETTGYDVYLFAHPGFSENFDNGWDARHMEGGELSNPLLCVPSELGNLDIAAIPELAGRVLKFVPSSEREYTFSMTYEGENELYLNDIKKATSTRIQTGNTYDFLWENGDGYNRFMISAIPFAPQTPTGVTNLDAQTPKAQKFIYKDKMYIMINGRVYSAEGALVK